ncbi:MAG: hypothetical protein CL663_05465 [Bacteroidetes bacterium]|nr:hypothetical protein [Bacteroidota bacterium]|tara:strand:+ start:203 stop:772 length:570 start_codon:yes stop_codon:yes gene_type:complete
MNSRRIEILLERYFSGETSLEDEKLLMEYFQGDDIPSHLQSLKGQFEYYSDEKEKEFLDESFDNKIIDLIQSEEEKSVKNTRRMYLYMASGIAASVLILMSLFFKFDPLTKKVEETFSDPEMAYNETRKALLLVSQTLNSGLEPMSKASKMNTGAEEIEKISSLNTGMNELNRVSKFYEIQQRFLNNKN